MADFALSCPRCGKAFAIRHRQAGQRYLCPHCRQPFSLQKAGEQATPPPPSAQSARPAHPTFIPEDLPAGPTKATPRRARKNVFRLFGPTGIVVAVVCVAVLFVWDRFERDTAKRAGNTSGKAATSPPEAPEGLQAPPVFSDRKPIELLLAPAGARIVIHLRPARLWTTMHCGYAEHTIHSPTWKSCELRLCLPALADWAGEQIENWCLYPPNQIDEAVFSFALRSPGDPPDVCVFVRLAQSAGHTDVQQRFGGRPAKKGPLPVFIKGERALVVRDEQTFAVGPADSAQEMVDARDQPSPTDASIEELLKQTDRSRDLTIVFRPDDLDRFRNSLLAPPWSDELHQVAVWLGPDAVEGAVFSVRLDDPVRLRLVARARPVVFGPRLAEAIEGRLNSLPTDLLKYVRQLQPSGSGSRTLIGRLPAMYKAVALGTGVATQRRLVTLESVLPERAAPNLSLATYLLLMEGPGWLPTPPAAPVVVKREAPKTLMARVQTVVDVDFRRTPLSEAFEAIGSDIGVNFDLDGGALKLVGYTKNLPQTFEIKRAPALESIRKILKALPKLALVADEAHNRIVVTTGEAAAAQKKKPMALGN